MNVVTINVFAFIALIVSITTFSILYIGKEHLPEKMHNEVLLPLFSILILFLLLFFLTRVMLVLDDLGVLFAIGMELSFCLLIRDYRKEAPWIVPVIIIAMIFFAAYIVFDIMVIYYAMRGITWIIM